MVRNYCTTTRLLLFALQMPLLAQTTVTISISPTTQTLRLDQTRQFTATVNNTTNKAVTWAVGGVVGGNSTLGTISTSGLYTPPAVLPSGNSVTVRVTSVANTTKFANATVNLQNPIPSISSVTPTELNPGTYPLVVMGTKFQPGAIIKLQGTALATNRVASTELRASGSFAAAGTHCVIVENPAPAAGASAQKCFTVLGPISVTISPTTATVRGGTTRLFTRSVKNTSDNTVDWLVNNVVGGNATVGTIGTDGTFTAPMNIAAVGGSVKVAVRSKKAPSAIAESTVTLQNPVPVISSISPATLPIGNASFSITGNGFASGATVNVGGAPMAATVVSLTQINVTGVTKPVPGGIAAITVSNIAPGPTTSAPRIISLSPANAVVTYAAAKRFLEQATWGASPAEIYRVMQMGFSAWLDEQKNFNESDYTMPTPNGDIPVYDMQAEFFNNAMTRRDQLRQRTAFSLHKVFVVSANDVDTTHGLVPYHRVLLRGAFGNFKELLRNITLDVGMGQYLDMVNNDKANPAKNTEPNENYGREVMQLFTIGTQYLRADGSLLRDPNGNPYSTYNQDDIMGISRALTGWTYPPGQGKDSQNHNKENYGAPMAPVESNHDVGTKRFLGRNLAAGQTATQDLDATMNILADHPNVAPFIALRLIQSHVTSNPSGSYIMRVVQAFNNNGAGQRGDLFATMRAVLLDPEARAGDNPAAPNPYGAFAGHLRDPLVYIIGVIKALEGAIILDNPLEADIENMGFKVFYPASVFSYYSPFSRVPGSPLAGPEFQGLSPVNALERVNYIHYLLKQDANAEAQVVLAPYIALAGDVEALIASIDAHFMHGTMPDVLKQGIRDTVATSTVPATRARLALYLALTSSHYQVKR
jgi:uncharacterized protein (DUF1800 family)